MKSQFLFRCCMLPAVCMALATVVNAQHGNQGIVPPNQKIQGLTYGDWSAKWWEFAYTIPADKNPLTVDDGLTIATSVNPATSGS